MVNDCGPDVRDVVSQLNENGNIRYIRHSENRGLAATRNTGVKAAHGKYIAYLDDDDFYYPNHIETLVGFLESTDHKFAYTDAYRASQKLVNGELVTTKRDAAYSCDFDEDVILSCNFIPVLCVMHEKSCIDEVGCFDELLKAHEDWDLWIRMSRAFPFGHIKKITCEFTWRDDGGTMTSGSQAEYLRTQEVIYDKYSGHSKDKPRKGGYRTRFPAFRARSIKTRFTRKRTCAQAICSIILAATKTPPKSIKTDLPATRTCRRALPRWVIAISN